jgi:hypothetical protein
MDIGVQKEESRDTKDHIELVRQHGLQFINRLRNQIMQHDASKLFPPEQEAFDKASPKLKSLTVGTDAYNESLKELGVALQHHYEHTSNRHHPEHFKDGIKGMNLVDLCEMFIDWAAATQRHENGDIAESVEKNAKRFGYDEPLISIFKNTARDLQIGKKCCKIP